MSPPASAKRKPRGGKAPAERLYKPHPSDEAHVRAAFDEADRGEGIIVTPEELKRWAETGEWPDSFD